MKRLSYLVIVVVSIVLILSSNKTFAGQLGSELKLQPQTGPTLQETMDYIVSKLEGHEGVLDCKDKEDNKPWKTSLMTHSFVATGCELQFTVLPSGYEGNQRERRIRLNLSKVDKVELLKRDAFRGGYKCIPYLALYVDGYTSGGEDNGFSFDIDTSSQDFAERLLKAFKHAQELCKTDKSSKELF